jgi:hypothetical protein
VAARVVAEFREIDAQKEQVLAEVGGRRGTT